MCTVTYADHILRVQQCVRVLKHVLFCQRVQMVDNNARPNWLSVSYHPIRDLVVGTAKVASCIPHNDPVPELPPLSRLVKALVQPPVKAKGIVSNRTVQLQIVEAVFKRCILTKFRVCLPGHMLSTPYTSRPWQMRHKLSKDKSAYRAGSQDLPFHHGKRIQMQKSAYTNI